MRETLFADEINLQTTRLSIRRFQLSDQADTFEWCRDPEVSRFLSWEPHTTPKDTERFFDDCAKQYGAGAVAPWAVVLRQSSKVIGSCNFINYEPEFSRAEIGYCLHRQFWGLGLGSEAVKAVLDFGFANGLKRIQATCEIGNTASVRLLKRVGFHYEGLLRRYARKNGALIDVEMYAVISP